MDTKKASIVKMRSFSWQVLPPLAICWGPQKSRYLFWCVAFPLYLFDFLFLYFYFIFPLFLFNSRYIIILYFNLIFLFIKVNIYGLWIQRKHGHWKWGVFLGSFFPHLSYVGIRKKPRHLFKVTVRHAESLSSLIKVIVHMKL